MMKISSSKSSSLGTTYTVMKTFSLRRPLSLLLLFSLSSISPTNAQFTCTFTAADENSCLSATADDGAHCVWCSLASAFGFCISESQAEAMEQSLPNIHCDRYSDNDDDSVDDDKIAPTDDSLPDDFWTCLQKKTANDCTTAGCTWCDAKAGFSLCMTGPTAESANESDFFTCNKTLNDDELEEEEEVVLEDDPYDTSCVLAYMEDPTQEGCTNTVDEDGNHCEWCSLAGMADLCLTQTQADMGSQLGITCDGRQTRLEEDDPYDTSCLLAYLQDPTPDACKAAKDQDGQACEWCSLQGSVDLCLTQEQAEIGEQIGIQCDQETMNTNLQQEANNSPLDTSCVMAFLQGNQDEESCIHAVDQDGEACLYCSVGGMGHVCLTVSQADMAGPLPITCDNAAAEEEEEDEVLQDPYDPSCLVAYLQDQSEEACKAAVDEDGDACEYCTLQGALNLCLTMEQAEIGEQIGAECDNNDKVMDDSDLYDKSCVMSGATTQSDCTATKDEDGLGCQWCHLQDVADVCLTATQADLATQLGVWCDGDKEEVALSSEKENVGLPDDFWKCLENYDEDGCNADSCTWCDSNVGMGFCMADAAARALKECDFFDCDYKTPKMHVQTLEKMDDPYDPVCLAAGMGSDDAEDVCNTTTDSDGKPCVWCNAAGVFGLCLSSEQADKAGQFLQCDSMIKEQ